MVPLPQRLGKALALKDREREVRALRVSTPEAHDETEGLREKEAQGVELLLTAPLWEPELQREGQLEVLTEREGAPVRVLAPLAVGAPADAQALAEKVRETLELPVPLRLLGALLEPEEQGVAVRLPGALFDEEGQCVDVRLTERVDVPQLESVALRLLEWHGEPVTLPVFVREVDAQNELKALRVPLTVTLTESLTVRLGELLPLTLTLPEVLPDPVALRVGADLLAEAEGVELKEGAERVADVVPELAPVAQALCESETLPQGLTVLLSVIEPQCDDVAEHVGEFEDEE